MKSLFFIFLCLPVIAFSQENYEIQVYASPTMQKGSTIFELHSNYTFSGERNLIGKLRPSYHALHETIEITHGISNNFELGFYLFTNATSSYGWQVVGTHLRPRITVPEKWKLPVGLSLSAEIGYQRAAYANDTWSLEIRPVIDRQFGKLYLSLNPVLGIQLKGEEPQSAPAFAPNIKVSWAFSKKVSFGTEYYGDLGALNHFESTPDQSHALFAVFDLYLHPDWEVNVGYGWGLTNATDAAVAKILIGRRINWKKGK